MNRRFHIALYLIAISFSVVAQTSIKQELALFTSNHIDKTDVNITPIKINFDSIIHITEGVNIEISLKKETAYYHDGTKKFVRYYQDTIPFGTWTYYSPNGKVKHSINNFKKYHVINTYFTNNNIQKSRKYKNKQHKIDSPCLEEQYYPNGSMFGYGKLMPSNHINRIELSESGKWLYFHPNGELASKGKFTSGKKEGLWQFYDKTGTKNRVVRFKNGNIISQKEY